MLDLPSGKGAIGLWFGITSETISSKSMRLRHSHSLVSLSIFARRAPKGFMKGAREVIRIIKPYFIGDLCDGQFRFLE